ncbi:hypothetical protein [Arsenicibacter rosenii]|uniref:hypothetical protein n=1 Tax=Arsenicibacter rosenii TaxID=1750698 RepID=UPI000A4B293C|nr:hypothetical protein [Arsenicibacter rosenii]
MKLHNSWIRRIISLGLLTLLLYHALGTVLVSLGVWWQEEHDLSKRLTVYRSVDSLVEFQIALTDHDTGEGVLKATEEGFTYRGHYFDVVSLEIKNNVLYVSGLENKHASFWQRDLLSFMKETIHARSESERKASNWLKLLLKEYSPNTRNILCFFLYDWRDHARIPVGNSLFTTRSLPVHSPPPRFV